MITFLSSPKPFKGEAEFNQRNAILSWLAVHPDAQVILYGDSPGTEEICCELGLTYVPNVKAAPSGIPYFGAIVDHAELYGKFDIQCYLNCDILLTPTVCEAAGAIQLPRFLMAGQRIDLAEGYAVDAKTPAWWKVLPELSAKGALELQPPFAIDYFVFPRGLWKGLKPLIIGRAGYDNALLGFCLRHDIPIVDGSESVLAIHQFHGYGHAKGGKKEVYLGSEAAENRRIHEVEHSVPSIGDASFVLRDKKLVPSKARGDRLRAAELYSRYRLRKRWLGYGFRAVWRVGRSLKLLKSRDYVLSDLIGAHFGTR